MLYFHVGNHCFRGMDILNDIMARKKTAYLYSLDVNPQFEAPQIHQLYCVPKRVVFTCIKEIVEDHCGEMTGDLVQDYLIYIQDRLGEIMQSGGIPSNLCDQDIGVDNLSNISHMPSSRFDNLDFVGLLDIVAPDSVLDTVAGKQIVEYLQRLPEKELCSSQGLYPAYQARVMISDAKTDKNQLNILQFGQKLFQYHDYHGAQCDRLEQFASCWNLLQETCQPVERGFRHHATLLIESCKLQSEMAIIVSLAGHAAATLTLHHCQPPNSLGDHFAGFIQPHVYGKWPLRKETHIR